MRLQGADESVLVIEITEALQKSKFDEDGYLDFTKEWDAGVEKKLDDNFRSNISKILDGQKLSSFVKDQLKNIRLSESVSLPPKGGDLTDLKCFKDPLSVSRKIVSVIKSLPFQYIFLSRVCHEFAERSNRSDLDFKISDRMRLVSGAEILSNFKVEHDNEEIDQAARGQILSKGHMPSIEGDGFYLEYRSSGYVSHGANNPLVSEFYEEMRSFYGVLINQDIYFSMTYASAKGNPIVIVNKVDGSSKEFSYANYVDEDLTKCYSFITPSTIDERLDSGESVEKILEGLRKVFVSENSLKLKAAASWLLRAQMSPRNLDKAIEYAIALEVLLGDRDTSDRIGLSKLMANRCAYALGKDEKERQKLTAMFLKFYKLRSEIVHSGRTAMSSTEREIINNGRYLANRMLKDEIRRLG